MSKNKNTQVKTIVIKLNPANTGKLGFLEKTRDQVENVARDFLKFKMRQLQDDKEHHYGKEFNQHYSRYRCGLSATDGPPVNPAKS